MKNRYPKVILTLSVLFADDIPGIPVWDDLVPRGRLREIRGPGAGIGKKV